MDIGFIIMGFYLLGQGHHPIVGILLLLYGFGVIGNDCED